MVEMTRGGRAGRFADGVERPFSRAGWGVECPVLRQ